MSPRRGNKPVQLLRHNGFDDRFQPAKLIADYTKKGTGLTIEARIVTDSWTDKETKEQRTLTKLQLINMTLAPKGIADQKPVESKANVAGGQEVTSLWGGRTGDPEEQEFPALRIKQRLRQNLPMILGRYKNQWVQGESSGSPWCLRSSTDR